MKHLKYFNESIETNQPLMVGDTIKIILPIDGEEHIAKVVKICAANSYIINIQKNNRWINDPIAVTGQDIVGQMASVGDPATQSDWAKIKVTKISNDLAINGYPSGTSNATDMGYTSGAPSNL